MTDNPHTEATARAARAANQTGEAWIVTTSRDGHCVRGVMPLVQFVPGVTIYFVVWPAGWKYRPPDQRRIRLPQLDF